LSDDDLNAMAAYLKSLPATAQQASFNYDDATTKALLGGKQEQPGATLFLGNCVSCHGANGNCRARISRRSPAIRSRSTAIRGR
jgi:alcohol dehydrogenase (quinone), cytochrome c subunit